MGHLSNLDIILTNCSCPACLLCLSSQYFFGTPPTSFDKGRDATFLGDSKKGDPTGEYTFVFKH